MNIFTLSALLTLNKSAYEKGLSEAEGKASSIGSKIGSSFSAMASATTKAIGLASTAVSALVATSVKSTADYEQNLGGVKKIYEGASSELTALAQIAYKTTQMSANQYMETATSFSVALKNSTSSNEEAVAQTDKAMRSIADNWNTFGGDLDNISNAYKGFAKQNYTMLDNLKLGYGGTKTEMERLIADANEYATTIGRTGELSIDSFSDIVDAIDLVQQKQNIAGTSMNEAYTTITGSISMMKASWENFSTALSDTTGTWDLDKTIGNLVDSVVGFDEVVDGVMVHRNGVIENVMPAVQNALNGIGKAIEAFAPVIQTQVPQIIDELLPSIISSATTLITSLVSVLPSLLQTIIECIISVAPQLLSAVGDVGQQVITMLPELFTTIVEAIGNLVEGITEYLPIFVEKGAELIMNLGEGLKTGIPEFLANALPMLLEFSEKLRSGASTLIDAGLELILNIVQGLANALPELIAYVPQIVTNIASIINDNAPKILETGFQIIVTLIGGIINAIPSLIENFGNIVTSICAVIEAFNWFNLGSDVIKWISDGVKSLITAIPELIKNIGNTAWEWFKNVDWLGLGMKVVNFIVNGVSSLGGNIGSTLLSLGKSALSMFQNINWLNLGMKVVRFIANGIKGMVGLATSAIGTIGNGIKNGFSGIIAGAIQWGVDLISNFVRGITNSIGKVVSAVSNVASKVKTFIGFSEPEEGPLSNFHTYAPDMMQLFASGIRNNADLIEDAFNDSLGFAEDGINLSGTYDLSGNTKSLNGSGSNSNSYGDVSIVINATDKQSSKDIADEVMYRLQHIKERNEAVFG